ncbi:hypothetical protein [uncultured Rubinisphaera sp.]|uniref:hypothetical protein n=1 Tax=uncultured Rubinisphaera sp. TaxID=1678686 RepID=UPI0030DAE139|tara:strand:- start:7157 stop:9373 length:2217 start_codon:yes stop_codon:yes gene_type:complete
MKLTLRYLLAYLDDILKPQDAAAVGRLVKSSPNATALVERIRALIRMRRLTVPAPAEKKKGLNANDVAEYLDNLTPVDEVVAYEESLLKSDEKLAEVAGTHQILSLVLGGKPKIPASTKSQLQQIAISFLPDDAQFPDEASQSTGSSVEIPAMMAPSIEPASPEIAIPFEIPKRNDGFKQFLIILGVILLLGAWAYSILTDPSFKDAGRNYAERSRNIDDPVNGNPIAGVGEVGTSELVAGNPEGTSVKVPAPQKMNQQPHVAVTTPTSPVAPASTGSANMPSPENTDTELAANNIPGEPMVPEENATGNGAGNQAMAPAVVQPNPIQFAPSMTYVTEGQPLIYVPGNSQTGGSVAAETGTEIKLNSSVFSPQYALASFTINNDRIRLQMRENSAAQLIGSDNELTVSLRLLQGQFLLEVLPVVGDDSLTTLQLVIGKNIWTMTLPDQPTTLVLEVIPQPTNQFEQIPTNGLYVANLWSTGAPVSLQRGAGQPSPPGNYFALLPLNLAASPAPPVEEAGDAPDNNDNPPPAENNQLTAMNAPPLPAWSDGGPLTMTLSQKRDQQEFQKYFGASNNLWLDMQGVADDPNPRIAELAARVLALGRQYDSLVTILARSPHEETRTEAIRGLRIWLPQDPTHPELLKESLAKTFNPETAQTVYTLLWGFTLDDGRRPDISRRLVDGLRHEHVAVRELSIYWIAELTGQKLGYRPLAVANTREQAVTSWERHLARVGALVAPE